MAGFLGCLSLTDASPRLDSAGRSKRSTGDVVRIRRQVQKADQRQYHSCRRLRHAGPPVIIIDPFASLPTTKWCNSTATFSLISNRHLRGRWTMKPRPEPIKSKGIIDTAVAEGEKQFLAGFPCLSFYRLLSTWLCLGSQSNLIMLPAAGRLPRLPPRLLDTASRFSNAWTGPWKTGSKQQLS